MNEVKDKKKKIKCSVCQKKLGCFEYSCRCGKQFCITHYAPEMHECSHDFKKDARDHLRKEMVVGKLVDMERV